MKPPLSAQTAQEQTAGVLLVPGLGNSGPGHWQSHWALRHGYPRLEQHDWQRPLRGDWMVQLEEAVLASDRPVVLVAHSLGCQLVASWAGHSRHSARVRAALLVAPADTAAEPCASLLPGWRNIAVAALPFASAVVASSNDSFCSLARARWMAGHWHSRWIEAGALGHINSDSALGDWPQGHTWLQNLLQDSAARDNTFKE